LRTGGSGRVTKIAKLNEHRYDNKQAAAIVERRLKSIRTQRDDDFVRSTLKKVVS